MNDEILEQKLQELPLPELPVIWREEILHKARRKAPSSSQKNQVWPTLLIYLRHLCVRNPVTTSAMAALWLLIFLFKASMPVDPSERTLIARFDLNRPAYLVSLRDEIRLAELWQDQPEQSQLRQIP